MRERERQRASLAAEFRHSYGRVSERASRREMRLLEREEQLQATLLSRSHSRTLGARCLGGAQILASQRCTSESFSLLALQVSRNALLAPGAFSWRFPASRPAKRALLSPPPAVTTKRRPRRRASQNGAASHLRAASAAEVALTTTTTTMPTRPLIDHCRWRFEQPSSLETAASCALAVPM